MIETDQQAAALAVLLAWHHVVGADAAVGEDAIDWLTRGVQPPGAGYVYPSSQTASQATDSVGTSARPVPERPVPAIPVAVLPPAPIAPLRTAARQTVPPARVASSAAALKSQALVVAESLAELEAKLRTFEGCGLKATATQLCFYRGAETADLMIIGDAPGREEDLEGRPFVGRAGQLLDKMLAAIGLSEANVHMTNLVYWRPPGKRAPSPQEVLACRPFLHRQIELVAPRIVLPLGGCAANQILGTDDGILRLCGKWSELTFGAHTVHVTPTLHPDYLLQLPALKRQAWRDLLAIKDRLKAVPPGNSRRTRIA